MQEFNLLTINKIIMLHENDNNCTWTDKTFNSYLL